MIFLLSGPQKRGRQKGDSPFLCFDLALETSLSPFLMFLVTFLPGVSLFTPPPPPFCGRVICDAHCTAQIAYVPSTALQSVTGESRKYRRDTPFVGEYRTSTSHALPGGNAQKRGRGYHTQLAMLRPKNRLLKRDLANLAREQRRFPFQSTSRIALPSA